MPITSVQNMIPEYGGRTSSISGANVKTLGKDAFLKLLIAQVEHQNPLEPLQGTEFTGQLAQFSSLEELSNVNANLENLKHYQETMNNVQAMGFIGKEVVAKGSTIETDNGDGGRIFFALDDAAAQVDVSIFDGEGKIVRILHAGPQGGGGGHCRSRGNGRRSGARALPLRSERGLHVARVRECRDE